MTRRVALAERLDSPGMQATRPSPVEAIIAPNGGVVRQIPVALIDPHPDNPRENLNLDDEFVASIASVGVLQPITVVTSQAFRAAAGEVDPVEDGRYVVLMGHRRRAAAEKAGLAEVQALIRDDLAGDDAEVVMLIENLHREDLNAMEEARGFAKLRDQFGLEQEAIAAKCARSQPHVSKRLLLLNLPVDLQAKVAAGTLGSSEAYELARHADDPKVLKAALTRSSWQTVDQVARDLKVKRERARKLDAKKAELKKKGLRVVGWPGYMYRDLADRIKYGRGAMTVEDLKTSGVDIRDHDALPCHATAVGFEGTYSQQLRTAAVCTKPENHAGHLEKAAEDKAAREQREADKLAQQAAARREFARAMLAGKPTKELTALVDELVLDRLFAGFNRPQEIAALGAVLGLDMEPPEVLQEINKLAKGPAAQRQRLIAAVAIAKIDLDIGRPHGDHDGAGTYLRWLQTQGHTLAGVERKLAGRKS